MPLIALDTETGGFVAAKNALISLAVVELDADLAPTDRRLLLHILPEANYSVEESAAKINGYTPELWAERKAIPLKAAMELLAEWMPEQAEAVAHNAFFDMGFLQHAQALTGITTKLSRSWTCSLERFRVVNRVLHLGAKDHKLGTLAAMSGHVWDAAGAHTAMADALACAHGFRWLQKKMTPAVDVLL